MEKLGYNWLIEHFSLTVLEPMAQCYLGSGNTLVREMTPDGVEVLYPERLRINGDWQGHLLFAIKREGVNLHVLKELFRKLAVADMAELVAGAPHSVYVRRLWFLYEFLMDKELPVKALASGNYQRLLSPDECLALDDAHSWHAKRQRLICNLPGNAWFCPMVRITPAIQEGISKNLSEKVGAAISAYPSDLIYRAASFLYQKETKSSYAIERLTPNQKRMAAFMAVLREAGKGRLDKKRLVHLQNTIVEERYAENDYRNDQVYVGQTIAPGREFVHFVGVKPEDVPSIMGAFIETANRLLESDCDPIIVAAVLSFAFVFIHPFDDGNGRLHRYLMHHVLCAKGFNPPNIIFPVSTLLYKNAQLYDGMLESFSRRLLPLVDYRLATDGSMTVANDTADYYRYIDFTPIVESFFKVVEETLDSELVPELDYLARWEHARSRMRDLVDMPERKAMQFILFTQQNKGAFPKGRRAMFAELSDDEIESLAEAVKEEIFSND